MATSLGSAPSANLRLTAKNSSSTTAIKRGTIVFFSSVAASNPAASFLDKTRTRDYIPNAGTATTMQELDVPYITVSAAGADSTNPGGTGRLGVAAADIPANGIGEIIVYGLARVLGGGATTVGEVITSDASGFAVDAANATHDNPIGLALETLSAGNLGWAFIWISPCGVGAAANVNYMGQDY